MKTPGIGKPTHAKTTLPPDSKETESTEKQGKTDKGKKVSLKSKIKSMFSGKSKKYDVKTKSEQQPLGSRDARPSEPAGSVKKHDDRGATIAWTEGYVESYVGAHGLAVHEVLKLEEELSASRDSLGSVSDTLTEGTVESAPMETSAVEEGDRLLQIVKDSAEAGLVKDDIEALVDASQAEYDQVFDLADSISKQKHSVAEDLVDSKSLQASAEASQAQLSQQVADATSQVNQWQGVVSGLQDSIADTREAIVNQQKYLSHLQNGLAEAQSQLDVANSGVEDGYNDAANQAVEQLTALINQHKSELVALQDELKTLNNELVGQSAGLASAQDDLTRLQIQLAEADKTVTILTEDTTTVSDQLDALEQDYQQSLVQLAEASEERQELIIIDNLANDAAEAGDLERVQELLADAKEVAGEAEATVVAEAVDTGEVVVSQEAEAISGLLDPLSVGVDVGAGLLAHSITLGRKIYKHSKLKNRQEAFSKCGAVIGRWKEAKDVKGLASVQDLKDYALIAKLSDGGSSIERTDHLRTLLNESKCHFSDDRRMAKLAETLMGIAGQKPGAKDSVIPKDWRGMSMAEQLKAWKADFEQKGKDYQEGKDEGKTRRADGKKQLKRGHQSIRLMKQFNAIVKTLGVEIEYKAPVIKKGAKAVATGHRFIIHDKKLHAHLSKVDKLPARAQVQAKVLDYQEDVPVLGSFANYELRKIAHQKRQINWTGAALATSMIPLLKVDYGVRALRELEDGNYRSENNLILDSKLMLIGVFAQSRIAMLDSNPALKKALELAADVIDAKKDRTSVKQADSDAQASIDMVGATAGTAASLAAPGVGSLATSATVGVAKLTAAGVTIAARVRADRKNQQFGRIETKVYSALKDTFKKAGSKYEKRDILSFTGKLFDISHEQVEMLFKQSSEKDLVAAKGLIRLRFTNTPVARGVNHSGKVAKSAESEPIYAEVTKPAGNTGKTEKITQSEHIYDEPFVGEGKRIDRDGYEIPVKLPDNGVNKKDEDTHL